MAYIRFLCSKSSTCFKIECLLNIWVPIKHLSTSWLLYVLGRTFNTPAETRWRTTVPNDSQLRSAAIWVCTSRSTIISETSAAAVCRDHGHDKAITKPIRDEKEVIAPRTVTAKRFREQRKARQKRRNTGGSGCGGSTKKSVMSTLAITVTIENGMVKNHCLVCSFGWKMNSNGSNINIVLHYRMKHAFTLSRIERSEKNVASKEQIQWLLSSLYTHLRNK